MKIKIIANGNAGGTQVINADTGEHIDGVIYVNIYCDSTKYGVPYVELGLTDVELDIVAAQVKKLPAGMTGFFGE